MSKMARHGASGPKRCMTDVAYQFNLTLLQKYEPYLKILLYLTCSFMYNI